MVTGTLAGIFLFLAALYSHRLWLEPASCAGYGCDIPVEPGADVVGKCAHLTPKLRLLPFGVLIRARQFFHTLLVILHHFSVDHVHGVQTSTRNGEPLLRNTARMTVLAVWRYLLPGDLTQYSDEL